MKTLKTNITEGVKFLISLALILLIAIGCSDNSTDSNDDDDDNGNGDNPPTRLFDSGQLDPRGEFTYTFEDEGDFDYFCQIHAPDMAGTVTVSSEADSTGRDTVMMQGMSFVPAELTVAPNTEVVWINSDDLIHTVTSGTPDDDNNDGSGDPRY